MQQEFNLPHITLIQPFVFLGTVAIQRYFWELDVPYSINQHSILLQTQPHDRLTLNSHNWSQGST